MTNKFLKLFTLLVFASLLLVSCNKEELTPETPTETGGPNQEVVEAPDNDNSGQINAFVSSATTDSLDCYTIDFPITFVYEDGTTVTANTEADLEDIFGEDEESYPWEIGYPVNLVNPVTGETVSAANEEELITYFMECEGFDDDWDDEDGDWDDEDGDWDDENPCDSLDGFGNIACYDIIFPLGFTLEDGSTVTAANEDDLANIFTGNNPPVDFAYPITLENEEGETFTANNEEEVGELIEECDEFGDWDDEDGDWDENGDIVFILSIVSIGELEEDCYEYVYPITVTQNGENVTLNSNEEVAEFLGTVVPGSGADVDFVYPVQVTSNDTGETLTANNVEEAAELAFSCL